MRRVMSEPASSLSAAAMQMTPPAGAREPSALATRTADGRPTADTCSNTTRYVPMYMYIQIYTYMAVSHVHVYIYIYYICILYICMYMHIYMIQHAVPP